MTTGPVHLPGFLGDVAKSIGGAAALNLAANYGGSTIHIPKTVSADSPLAKAVGLPAAEQIAEKFGPGNFYIALAGFGARARLRECIDRMTAEGESEARIARSLGIADRTVRRQRARARRQRKDLPLFSCSNER